MKLIRWNPVHNSGDRVAFERELNHMFDELLVPSAERRGYDLIAPPVDADETDEAYVLRVDLPGFSAKDVKVSLNGDVPTLRGERRREDASNPGGTRLTERAFGSFERSFRLSKPVQADQVQATYRAGVLEVLVPKAEEARVREIEVQVG